MTIAGGLYFRHQLRASLPLTDGEIALNGLSAAASAERDAFGIPTVTAATRADAAQVLGFLHAQDRFFQMDLQRRQAAGELSGLVGRRGLDADRSMRVHRFRTIARAALERAAPAYRAVLDAYARGVNHGLAALGAAPPEYFILRAEPEPWAPEDTLLTILAMFNTLQGRQASFEATFGSIADNMPAEVYQFLTARGSEWDAPVAGERLPRPAIPGAAVFNLHDNESRLRPSRRDGLPVE
jgi:penicillin amidase